MDFSRLKKNTEKEEMLYSGNVFVSCGLSLRLWLGLAGYGEQLNKRD